MRRSSRSGSRNFADLLAVKRGVPARRTYMLRTVPGHPRPGASGGTATGLLDGGVTVAQAQGGRERVHVQRAPARRPGDLDDRDRPASRA